VQALREAQPGFLVAMVPLTLLLYVGSTFELLGACSVRLPFGATYRCQMAAAFMNRVTPSNVGGMAVNARYLQVSGVDAATATATVGLTSATEMIVNVVLVLLFFTWAGRGTSGISLSLPSATAVRVVVAVIAIAAVIFALAPRGRRLMKDKVLPFLRGVRTSLREVARSPLRMLAMFGGGLGRAVVDFAALVIALAAFGSTPSIAALGAAYIGASVLASASPTPGGVSTKTTRAVRMTATTTRTAVDDGSDRDTQLVPRPAHVKNKNTSATFTIASVAEVSPTVAVAVAASTPDTCRYRAFTAIPPTLLGVTRFMNAAAIWQR